MESSEATEVASDEESSELSETDEGAAAGRIGTDNDEDSDDVHSAASGSGEPSASDNDPALSSPRRVARKSSDRKAKAGASARKLASSVPAVRSPRSRESGAVGSGTASSPRMRSSAGRRIVPAPKEQAEPSPAMLWASQMKRKSAVKFLARRIEEEQKEPK